MSKRHSSELFAAFSKYGWDERGWSPKTRKTYYTKVRAANAWLEQHRGVSVCWAKTNDLKAYMFSRSINPRTRNVIREALIGFGDFLIQAGYTQTNTARGLSRLPTPKLLPRPLARETVQRVLAVARTLGPYHEILVLMLLWTGLRRAELLGLEWKDFLPGIRSPEVWLTFMGKGSKERSLPIHNLDQGHLHRKLVRWHGEASDRWVFPSPRHPGRPLAEPTLARWLHEIGQEVGIRLTPHMFRHTCATALLDSGEDIRTVQEWLGHASLTSTQVYTKVHAANLVRASQALDFARLGSPDDTALPELKAHVLPS